ncbi:hypothetical protein NF212_12320 [Parasalinivibrio latis]|uniref:hypothetical protein n=1 Tax=Parasalinivibrio latis TaxID=2952610 RepID=UPI0030E3DFA4
MKKGKVITIVLSGLLVSPSTFAKEGLSFSFGLGGALNYQEDVKLKLDGQDDIDLGTLSFDTKPFQMPFYWDLKLGYWQENKGWELELLHHKLYASGLNNSRVSSLEVTHGYNLVYLNRAIEFRPSWLGRIGLGAVVPHPDMTIDGNKVSGGYHLAGPSAQLSLEKTYRFREDFLVGLEGKMTYSYAEVDFDGGSFELPNTAVHFLVSLQYDPE